MAKRTTAKAEEGPAIKEPTRKPQIGDVVLYHVNDNDSEVIRHMEAVILPAIIVHVWSEGCVNLKVFCDAPKDAWATSRLMGIEPGNWEFR